LPSSQAKRRSRKRAGGVSGNRADNLKHDNPYGDYAMPYTAIFLPKAEKYMLKQDDETYEQIEEHVEELKKDPYKHRPLADIRKLGGFKSPAMYRMRIGRQRLEYFVDESEKIIYIIKAFPRSGDSDYR
jgi:mRNA-degrading endonuclease RelE of RelBE toxin-antitoxin system